MSGTTVDTLIADLVKREGGYTNNPADRGGPTNYGITEQQARAYGFTGSMKLLPLATAEAIYKSMYWTRPGFDQVNMRAPQLAAELFDTGVNMGPKVAATFLQRALNGLNRVHTDYPDLVPDGDLGPMTMHALDSLIAKRGAGAAQTVLLRLTDALQATKYLAIAEANPTQETFLWGWIANRVGIPT